MGGQENALNTPSAKGTSPIHSNNLIQIFLHRC